MVLRGDEVLRLTPGLGIGFNMGGEPGLLWANDYADGVRSEWTASAVRGGPMKNAEG